jgi:hypothetical protein
LGTRLNRDGDLAKNIVRDADAAGFSRQELAAAYTALMAETTENNVWQLDAGKRAFWRNYILLNDAKPAFAAQPPAPMKVAIATAPPRPALAAPASAPTPRPAPPAPVTVTEYLSSLTPEQKMNMNQQRAPAAAATSTSKSVNAAEIYARRAQKREAAIQNKSGAAPSGPAARAHESAEDIFARRRREAKHG